MFSVRMFYKQGTLFQSHSLFTCWSIRIMMMMRYSDAPLLSGALAFRSGSALAAGQYRYVVRLLLVVAAVVVLSD
jgi:hypothetical protein